MTQWSWDSEHHLFPQTRLAEIRIGRLLSLLEDADQLHEAMEFG